MLGRKEPRKLCTWTKPGWCVGVAGKQKWGLKNHISLLASKGVKVRLRNSCVKVWFRACFRNRTHSEKAIPTHSLAATHPLSRVCPACQGSLGIHLLWIPVTLQCVCLAIPMFVFVSDTSYFPMPSLPFLSKVSCLSIFLFIFSLSIVAFSP